MYKQFCISSFAAFILHMLLSAEKLPSTRNNYSMYMSLKIFAYKKFHSELLDLAKIIKYSNCIQNTSAKLNFNLLLTEILFLLSSIFIRRKYWIRENFQLPVFDGFTCFEMS